MLGNKHIDLQYNIVQFNLVNPTSAAVNINLFDTSVLANIPNSPSVSLGSIYITGSSNYNQFVRDNMVNPKKLDRIMIYAQNESNLFRPVLVNTEDATGNTCSDAYLPNITVSASQYQGKIGQLDFKDVVLDVSTTLNVTIPSHTTIKWVLFYKQYDKSDLLSGSVAIKSLCSKKGTQTYDEKYLIDTALISSWVTIMETKNFIKN